LTVAYLCDVFVMPAYQGRGLGTELVREAVEGADLADLKWILHTDDAHGLYGKLGFTQPDERAMERVPVRRLQHGSSAQMTRPSVESSASGG
jgi:predicted N-acetyltransferase YhbS